MPPTDNAIMKRQRRFRKMFSDYTKEQAKGSTSRSSSTSTTASSASDTADKQGRNEDKDKKKPDDDEKKKKEKKGDEKGGVAEAKELNKADDEQFENADSHSNIASCSVKTRELQWKGGSKRERKAVEEDFAVRVSKKSARSKRKRSSRSTRKRVRGPSPNEKAEEMADIDENSSDFKLGLKLMGILKRNQLLENALISSQNEVVKDFFDSEMLDPDNKILDMISKAMDFVLDAILLRGDMDCTIDSELKNFMGDRSKCKPTLLDVIVARSEYLPLSWGGQSTPTKNTPKGEPEKEEKQ